VPAEGSVGGLGRGGDSLELGRGRSIIGGGGGGGGDGGVGFKDSEGGCGTCCVWLRRRRRAYASSPVGSSGIDADGLGSLSVACGPKSGGGANDMAGGANLSVGFSRVYSRTPANTYCSSAVFADLHHRYPGRWYVS